MFAFLFFVCTCNIVLKRFTCTRIYHLDHVPVIQGAGQERPNLEHFHRGKVGQIHARDSLVFVNLLGQVLNALARFRHPHVLNVLRLSRGGVQ